MKNILHIDSSVRSTTNDNPGYNSLSKQLASHFVQSWLTKTQANITYRDVGSQPPAFINQDWIGAVFTPEENRSQAQRQQLALSDTLIEEVVQADIIVMSSPMYNYGMPAQLKAWFDQVIRINKTFSFDLARGDTPLSPTLSGKTLVLITSSGEFGFEKGGMREHMNHLGPHVKTLSKYLGVEHFFEVKSEYQEFADDRHKASFEAAMTRAEHLAHSLAS